MVKKDQVEQFLTSMQEYYTKKRQWSKQLKQAVKAADVEKHQFVVKPSHGACIIDYNDYTLEQMTTESKSSEPKTYWGTIYDIALGVMYAYLVSQLMKLFFKYTEADKPIPD